MTSSLSSEFGIKFCGKDLYQLFTLCHGCLYYKILVDCRSVFIEEIMMTD